MKDLTQRIKESASNREVILVKTVAEFDELEKIVKSLNISWFNGDWRNSVERGNFCVNINALNVSYCDREWYEANNYKIIEFSELLKNNKTIVIYRKGNEVIALDKSSGKKAVAKCDPRDTFDFNIGAKLALERLTRNVTFRVLAVDDSFTYFTKGKVYEFIDGRTRWDLGSLSKKYNDYEHFVRDNSNWKNKLIELKDGDNPGEILKKIKVGDTVQIVDNGFVYSTYSKWVEKYVTVNEDKYRWDYNRLPINKRLGRVLYVAEHLENDCTLAYVNIDERCYVMDVRGLSK